MPKCRDNRKRRLKRAKREQQRLAAQTPFSVSDVTRAVETIQRGALLMAQACANFVNSAMPHMIALAEQLAGAARQREPWENGATPELVEPDALRRLLSAPTDGASAARFTSEGGIVN